MSPTEEFRKLNRQFFGGRLPPHRVVLKSGFPRHGECIPERRFIRLGRGLGNDPTELRRTLLHEMCHIGTPNHGRRFQAKLLKLAQAGEAWATQEAASYANALSFGDELHRLRELIEDLVLELSHDGKPGFRRVLAWLAKDFGMTSSELRRRAPWVRAAWEKEQARLEHARRKSS